MLKSLWYTGPSRERLHEEFVMHGRVDPQAPVQAEVEVLVDAPPATVWQVLADVRGWPSIDNSIHDVRIDGPVEPGAVFTWANGRLRVTSRVGMVDPGRAFSWTTMGLGFNLACCYHFMPKDAGATRLVGRESGAAPVVALLINSRALTGRVAHWLDAIKEVAEARPPSK